MKKTYFPHDSNSRNDIKLIRVRSVYGYEGYGVYFALIELLFAEGNRLSLDDIDSLAFGLQCKSDLLKVIIMNFDLFEIEDNCFYSKRLDKTLNEINKKSIKAKESASKRWGNANVKRPDSNRNTIKVNESKSISKSKLNKIEDRIHEFKNSVYSQNDFSDKDKNDFYLYWTEKNSSGTKFRAEMQRTFSIPLRLKRWCNNGFNKDKNKLPDYYDEMLFKKMDMTAKKEYEKHLKSLGYQYIYNPNSGGKFIKK